MHDETVLFAIVRVAMYVEGLYRQVWSQLYNPPYITISLAKPDSFFLTRAQGAVKRLTDRLRLVQEFQQNIGGC